MPPIENLQKIRMYKRSDDLSIKGILYMKEVKGLQFLKDLLKSSSPSGRPV